MMRLLTVALIACLLANICVQSVTEQLSLIIGEPQITTLLPQNPHVLILAAVC